MTRQELEIMRALKQAVSAAPDFVVAFMSGETTAEAETAFARSLVDIADALTRHAEGHDLVLDAEVIAVGVETVARLALEAGPGRLA